MIPFPRTGKRAALVAYPRTGKRAFLIPSARTGKRAFLIPSIRTGKRSLKYESGMPLRYGNGYVLERGERKDFSTNSEMSHESDLPSTTNDNIDNNHARFVRLSPSQEAENGINAEQDDTDLTNNLGLFDLGPERIGMLVQA